MFRGSDFDQLVQRRVFAERDWIDAQPGLVAQGRYLCLFNAENRSPQFLEELIERFHRVWVFIDTAAKTDWMSKIGAARHHAYPYLVFIGRQRLEHCKSLVFNREPPLRGASIVRLSEDGNQKYLERVQELYQRANLLPQPDYFVAGNNHTVITSVLLDEREIVIGATMFHHLAKVGPEYSQVGCALNSAISPNRSFGSRDAGEVRRSSLAAWLNASAVVWSREQFGTREIWSHARANNRRAIAFHRELGSIESDDVSCFCAEHRTVPFDPRHTGAVSGATGDQTPEVA